MEEANDSFSIVLGTARKIGIEKDPSGWWITRGPGTRRFVKRPQHPAELRTLVEAIAAQCGVVSQRPPGQARIIRGEPVSNAGRLVAMIGASTIEAVFDVYLENKSIANLAVLGQLGVRFTPSLRLLSSTQKAPAKLTKSLVQDFFMEVDCPQGEARYVSYQGHEHRLLFLSGGEVISLGGSLNSFNTNERMHRATDQGDLQTFESAWTGAMPL